jgi:hypothetical protein
MGGVAGACGWGDVSRVPEGSILDERSVGTAP